LRFIRNGASEIKHRNKLIPIHIDQEISMKQVPVVFLIGLALLLSPSTLHAGETRVYVGVSVGTAIVVGTGIASFNIGYNQRVGKGRPESPSPETNPSPALAEINREGKNETPETYPDFRINAPSVPPPTLRFEFPLFILRW
jgi:hypothetical protein